MKKLKMKPHGTNGMLITFCGLDGCGKSSMIELLSSELREKGYSVLLTKQPTDAMRKTEIFRTYMDDPDHSAYEYRTLSLMAAADRLQHTKKVILPALRDGKIVICDRYFYSCLANLRARGYENDKWIYEIVKVIPMPDLAFFLKVPVFTAVTRVRSREEERERYIDIPLQHRLAKEYKKICLENSGISLDSVDGVEATYENVKKYVYKFLEVKNYDRA